MKTPTQQMNLQRLFVIIDIIILLALGGYVLAGSKAVPFHGDESTLITLSKDYYLIFQKHDPGQVMYDPRASQDEAQGQRVLTGAIVPLTIGLAWDLDGLTYRHLNRFWVWVPQDSNDEWAYNVVQGNMPSNRLLEAARLPSTIFTILSILVVFGIGWRLTRSHLAACLAALIYITTPAVLMNGRRAMQEGAMLFFTTLVIYVAVRIIQEQQHAGTRWRRLTLGYLLLGAVAGLAVASKHNSALAAGAAYLAVLVAPLLRGSQPAEQKMKFSLRHVCALIGSGLLSVVVFQACMPVLWTWWPNTVAIAGVTLLFLTIGVRGLGRLVWALRGVAIVVLAGVSLMVPSVWAKIIEPETLIVRSRLQLNQWLVNTGVMKTYAERGAELGKELFFGGSEYFEGSPNWADFEELQKEIQFYETNHLDGRGKSLLLGGVLIILLVAGIWALLANRHGGETVLMLMWFVGTALTLFLTNPLPWQRYYIVLHPALGVLAGMGALKVWGVVSGRVARYSYKMLYFWIRCIWLVIVKVLNVMVHYLASRGSA